MPTYQEAKRSHGHADRYTHCSLEAGAKLGVKERIDMSGWNTYVSDNDQFWNLYHMSRVPMVAVIV